MGTKSYPIPSTSYIVLSVLFSSSGSARMEPSGSTPIIWRNSFLSGFGGHNPCEHWPCHSCWCHTANLLPCSFPPGNIHLPWEQNAASGPLGNPSQLLRLWALMAPLVLHGRGNRDSLRQACPHSHARHHYRQLILCQVQADHFYFLHHSLPV